MKNIFLKTHFFFIFYPHVYRLPVNANRETFTYNSHWLVCDLQISVLGYTIDFKIAIDYQFDRLGKYSNGHVILTRCRWFSLFEFIGYLAKFRGRGSTSPERSSLKKPRSINLKQLTSLWISFVSYTRDVCWITELRLDYNRTVDERWFFFFVLNIRRSLQYSSGTRLDRPYAGAELPRIIRIIGCLFFFVTITVGTEAH